MASKKIYMNLMVTHGSNPKIIQKGIKIKYDKRNKRQELL